MRPLEELIKEIIPPATREGRDGFSNKRIVQNLSPEERALVEAKLLKMLESEDDYLIAETLIALKSKRAFRIIKNKVKLLTEAKQIIIWASYGYELQKDPELERSAYLAFSDFEFKYDIESYILFFLAKFNTPKINRLIKRYSNHKYPLVAYQAKNLLKGRSNF